MTYRRSEYNKMNLFIVNIVKHYVIRKIWGHKIPFYMHVIVSEWVSEVAQLCLILCDPVDCSLPGSSVHGILQERILDWVAISFSRGSSWSMDWTWVFHTAGRRFTLWAIREALKKHKLSYKYEFTAVGLYMSNKYCKASLKISPKAYYIEWSQKEKNTIMY